MRLVTPVRDRVLMHMNLHETIETELCPATANRSSRVGFPTAPCDSQAMQCRANYCCVCGDRLRAGASIGDRRVVTLVHHRRLTSRGVRYT